MGVFKKFLGGISAESMQTIVNPNFSSTVVDWAIKPCKAINGQNIKQLCFQLTTAGGYTGRITDNLSLAMVYGNMKPYVTADDIESYNFSDYSITAIPDCSCSATLTQNLNSGAFSASQIYTIVITNGGNSSQEIRCIKFTKIFRYDANSRAEVLICGYYLDEPLTISAGESKTLTIEMRVGTDVLVS